MGARSLTSGHLVRPPDRPPPPPPFSLFSRLRKSPECKSHEISKFPNCDALALSECLISSSAAARHVAFIKDSLNVGQRICRRKVLLQSNEGTLNGKSNTCRNPRGNLSYRLQFTWIHNDHILKTRVLQSYMTYFELLIRTSGNL